MHQRTPGLHLEQTPKFNFWTPWGLALLTVHLAPSPPPFLIILPCPPFLVYYTFDTPVSHPIGHMFPYHYNAALITIANVTHFSTLLQALLLPIRDKQYNNM
jgi:hypothetical protein